MLLSFYHLCNSVKLLITWSLVRMFFLLRIGPGHDSKKYTRYKLYHHIQQWNIQSVHQQLQLIQLSVVDRIRLVQYVRYVCLDENGDMREPIRAKLRNENVSYKWTV